MKGKQYIITSTHFNGLVSYTYNLKGWLIDFHLDVSNIHIVTLNFFYDHLPKNLEQMKDWIANAKNFKVEEVPADISFDRFWTEYGKHGTKSVMMKRYNKLKDNEKISAILGIRIERRKKQKDQTAMPYAETYLNQKRWE
ncbi:hypothetical protein QP547_04570 [Weeksella virosa]|uniref:hypothetical protein n=1 Tax=Weeksella virosa TaxID=1014 RepID=UPI0025536EFE|nr:hypothetical protein [Weeksella virosa]MDK7675083.1 hypothetical protein [Weeksella virosa]